MPTRLKFALFALSLAPVVTAGCSHQTSAPDNGSTQVTGTVIAIDDRAPVDGEAAITLDRPGGDDLLAIPMRVDPVILRLEVGDQVTAHGVVTERGLRLEELVIR